MSVFNFEEHFVEVRFPEVITDGRKMPADNFLKVKETLTRIGAPAYDDAATDNETAKVLWQSCHILYKRQRYWIVHFKELFLLDGKYSQTNLTVDDLGRRNAIALLLNQWGLVELVNPSRIYTPPPVAVNTLKIIPYREKHLWQLRAKYDLGKPHRKEP